MKFPTIAPTPAIHKKLTEIEIILKKLSDQEIPLHVSHSLDNKNILKSSLYSARIEGNTLTETTIDGDDEIAKKEVFNLVDAATYVRSLPQRQLLTLDEVRRLHKMVMKDISSDAGMFRKSQNAIFDNSGTVRYLPPPPGSVMRSDMARLVEYVNTTADYPLLTALAAHLFFEKIHPFVDGNGRVGRLLITYLMKSYGAPFPIAVPFERYLEKHRKEYYRYLDIGLRAIDEYLLFMLGGLHVECEAIFAELKETKNQPKAIMLLSDRQREILSIIGDQPYMSIDSIWRRFRKIPIRNLRSDISVLLRKKLISKLGTTKGARYCKSEIS